MLRTAVRSIRAKADQTQRELHELRDLLEGQAQGRHDANPHGLSISESNDLFGGFKKLFNGSNGK